MKIILYANCAIDTCGENVFNHSPSATELNALSSMSKLLVNNTDRFLVNETSGSIPVDMDISDEVFWEYNYATIEDAGKTYYVFCNLVRSSGSLFSLDWDLDIWHTWVDEALFKQTMVNQSTDRRFVTSRHLIYDDETSVDEYEDDLDVLSVKDGWWLALIASSKGKYMWLLSDGFDAYNKLAQGVVFREGLPNQHIICSFGQDVGNVENFSLCRLYRIPKYVGDVLSTKLYEYWVGTQGDFRVFGTTYDAGSLIDGQSNIYMKVFFDVNVQTVPSYDYIVGTKSNFFKIPYIQTTAPLQSDLERHLKISVYITPTEYKCFMILDGNYTDLSSLFEVDANLGDTPRNITAQKIGASLGLVGDAINSGVGLLAYGQTISSSGEQTIPTNYRQHERVVIPESPRDIHRYRGKFVKSALNAYKRTRAVERRIGSSTGYGYNPAFDMEDY